MFMQQMYKANLSISYIVSCWHDLESCITTICSSFFFNLLDEGNEDSNTTCKPICPGRVAGVAQSRRAEDCCNQLAGWFCLWPNGFHMWGCLSCRRLSLAPFLRSPSALPDEMHWHLTQHVVLPRWCHYGESSSLVTSKSTTALLNFFFLTAGR